MSIVRAKTNPYGPALIDIQIEQGCDFSLGFAVKSNNAPVDLTGAVFTCHMSSSTPTPVCIDFTILPIDLSLGTFKVVFPSASTIAAPFNALPAPDLRPTVIQKYPVGAWILQWKLNGSTTRYVEGSVFLDRDPCLI